MKTVYLYDEKGLYTGAYDAQESPMEPGAFITPDLSIDIAPVILAGFCPKLINGAWVNIPDHRGMVYETATGTTVDYDEIGELPTNLTSLPKPLGHFNWVNGAWTEYVVIPTLTMRQARLALLNMALLDDVEAAITTTENRIWWDYSTTVERSNPLVISVLTALGKTSAEIDAMFISAAAI